MKLGVRGALGILLSAALLWWVLHDQDLGAIWQVLARSSVPLWIASTVFATLIFPLRARRWSALTQGGMFFISFWI